MMREFTKWFTVLAALLLCVSALASTPDGETPAEEPICDYYSGHAKGLCVSYCEAMDCDADPSANLQACLGIGDKFTELTGEPSLPCGDVAECVPEECSAGLGFSCAEDQCVAADTDGLCICI